LIPTKQPFIQRIEIPDKFYSVALSQEYLRKLAGFKLRISLNRSIIKE